MNLRCKTNRKSVQCEYLSGRTLWQQGASCVRNIFKRLMKTTTNIPQALCSIGDFWTRPQGYCSENQCFNRDFPNSAQGLCSEISGISRWDHGIVKNECWIRLLPEFSVYNLRGTIPKSMLLDRDFLNNAPGLWTENSGVAVEDIMSGMIFGGIRKQNRLTSISIEMNVTSLRSALEGSLWMKWSQYESAFYKSQEFASLWEKERTISISVLQIVNTSKATWRHYYEKTRVHEDIMV